MNSSNSDSRGLRAHAGNGAWFELIAAVKERHPEASKKEIAQAAFLSVILSAEYAPEDTQALHDLAMNISNDHDAS